MDETEPSWDGLNDEALFKYYFGRLVSQAEDMGVGSGEAEECAAEALHRTLRLRAQGQAAPLQLRSWLFRVGRNLAIDLLRRRRYEERWLQEGEASVRDGGCDERRGAALARHRLSKALEPREREFLRVWARQSERDLSSSDAADTLGLTLAAYEATKKRFRTRLNNVLADLKLAEDDLFDPDPVAAIFEGKEETS